MSFDILTTKEQADQNLANIEGRLNQDTPLADKAFNRVLSIVEALGFTSLAKFAIERALQNLALTATGGDLDLLGAEFDVLRKQAVSTVLTATLPGVDTTKIPQTVDFKGDANGVRYFLDASTEIGNPTPGVAELTLTAETPGVIGNLQLGDTLSIGTQIAGAETVATVAVITGQTTAILTTGAEREQDDAYRLRVLDQIRALCGGGNTTDYRLWAQEVAGVARAYPYAGKPIELFTESSPPDRVVYVEADTTIDADGLAPQSLLNQVRDSITTDPTTGRSRQPLGLTDDTLFVESIIRTGFFVQINDLTVNQDIVATVKAAIESALSTYFRGLRPFVDGVDSILDRNDLITDLTVSAIVQDVLTANGGSASAVAFGLLLGDSLPEYRLQPGETSKLVQVTYV